MIHYQRPAELYDGLRLHQNEKLGIRHVLLRGGTPCRAPTATVFRSRHVLGSDARRLNRPCGVVSCNG